MYFFLNDFSFFNRFLTCCFCFEGVSSFIVVGLERVRSFEDAVLLEFGRGFRYKRPLHVNLMDLEYELLDELVRTVKQKGQPTKMGKKCINMLCN